jgi:hypothetical protein
LGLVILEDPEVVFGEVGDEPILLVCNGCEDVHQLNVHLDSTLVVLRLRIIAVWPAGGVLCEEISPRDAEE